MALETVVRASLESREAAFAGDVAEVLEIVAICLIVASVVAAFVVAVIGWFRLGADEALRRFKHTFSRGLLVGLDVLIAADIINTITIDPTLENVSALGVLVLVRIFLSWSLIVEVEERWPWERSSRPSPGGPSGDRPPVGRSGRAR
jgi:uncharacterized membrane protein